MDIAVVLGLGRGGPQLEAAAEAWRSWVAAEDALPDLPGLADLPDWARAQSAGRVDEVLWTLARLGAPDGGGESAAVAALAWLLLPGARRVARSLGGGRYAEDVAAQLWLECVCFPWPRLRRVAANVLWNVHRAVATGYGLHGREVLVDPTDVLWEHAPAAPPPVGAGPASERLADLLEAAAASQRLSEPDVHLLLALADGAPRSPFHPRPRRGGLMAAGHAEQLGAQLGLSGRTVRRRASAALGVLRDLAAVSAAAGHGPAAGVRG
jgi:hypothetical protein